MKLAHEPSNSAASCAQRKKCLQWSMTSIFLNRWGFSKVLKGISCSLLQRIAVMDGHLSPRSKCNACFPQTTIYKTLTQFLLSILLQVDWGFYGFWVLCFFSPQNVFWCSFMWSVPQRFYNLLFQWSHFLLSSQQMPSQTGCKFGPLSHWYSSDLVSLTLSYLVC